MKLLNKLAIFCCVAALVAAPVIFVTAQAADSAEKPKNEKKEKKEKKAPIELNNATAAQLQTLKGIDANIARQIMQNRPFRSISELVSKKIISKEAFKEIEKDIITGKYEEPQNKKKQNNNNKNKSSGGGKRRR